MRPFHSARSGDWDYLITAWIERSGDAADVPALAGGVPSLVHNDHRSFAQVELVVQLFEFFLFFFEFFLVLLPFKRLV